MRWQRLDDAAGWCGYRRQLTTLWALDGITVDWGGDPVAYPVLVASHRTAPARVMTAMVYPEDARLLLAGVPAWEVKAACGPSQDDFNRSVQAHLLTIVSYLPEQYAKEYVRNLATLDRWNEEDHERFLRGVMPARHADEAT